MFPPICPQSFVTGLFFIVYLLALIFENCDKIYIMRLTLLTILKCTVNGIKYMYSDVHSSLLLPDHRPFS